MIDIVGIIIGAFASICLAFAGGAVIVCTTSNVIDAMHDRQYYLAFVRAVIALVGYVVGGLMLISSIEFFNLFL